LFYYYYYAYGARRQQGLDEVKDQLQAVVEAEAAKHAPQNLHGCSQLQEAVAHLVKKRMPPLIPYSGTFRLVVCGVCGVVCVI
jgi:hypothetical protein